MTKANQVAPMLAMLRGLIPDATEAIGEFAKLAEYVDETEARATQAERDRDAWRAKWEALETTRAVCCDQMERERDEARAERDAAVDRLVGARVARESAFEDADDLRAQLAKTEAVVEAAREDAQHCPHACSPPCPFDRAVARTRAALRALDSPVVAGTDSGGSDGTATREDAGTAPSGSERSTPPEPAGSSQDSPVGVAATACDHKRQRCENDHAVCRDCGAVNRAVTGVADWGPPETDRTDGSTGAVACPVCRCLKVGHHPGGCEGAGGNCGCTERFPEGRGRAVEKPDPQAPVTRAELDELRWRVERLENLTGSGSGFGYG